MLPYLLSTENINEFENIIQKRFFGVERFIRQGKNLYKFVKYTEERRDPIIWINDLERGIVGWDMGLLVGLVRSALGSGYITKEEAWRYIEQANTLCADVLHTPEEIDKLYAYKESLPENKQFIEENKKETLAQVFTDVRYTKKDNEFMSENLLKVLRQQGFLK